MDLRALVGGSVGDVADRRRISVATSLLLVGAALLAGLMPGFRRSFYPSGERSRCPSVMAP
jgi:hypothetical protein